MIGRIQDICWNQGSGLAVIVFDTREVAYIEAGFGLRQLDYAFDGLDNAVGQTIEYEVNELNVMTGFTPEALAG